MWKRWFDIIIIWLHYVLFQPHAALEQFKRGLLETLQFNHLVKSYPKEVWGILAASTIFNVTPQYLCEAFVVQYSANGSNNRTKEEAIVLCGMTISQNPLNVMI